MSGLRRSSGGRPKPIRVSRAGSMGTVSEDGVRIRSDSLPVVDEDSKDRLLHALFDGGAQPQDSPSRNPFEEMIKRQSGDVALRQQDTTPFGSRSSSAFFSPQGREDEAKSYFTASPEVASPFSSSPAQSPRILQGQLRSAGPSRQATIDSIVNEMNPTPSSPPPQSPSHRWDQLRNALGANTAEAPAMSSSQPSASSFSQYAAPLPSPALSGAGPKTPRLGRFGFRQVVEQASQQVSLHASARFENDLRRACWEAKYGEGSGMAQDSSPLIPLPPGNGSGFNLPLSSSASAMSGSPSVGLKRPPSVQSMSTAKGQRSIRILYQTLVSHAPLTTSATGPSRMRLPLEDDVMSVLLSPFLSKEQGKRIEDEQWLAIETFEMITKTWRSPTMETELERWLWCTKVAGCTISQTRRRVLGILSLLLFAPNPPFPIRAPIVLQTIVGALAMLRRTMSPQEPEDRFLRDMITKIGRGDSGALTAKDLTDEYGVPCTAMDEDREPELRTSVIVEGVLRCMQVGSEASRRWVLHHLEDYWDAETPDYNGRITSLEIQIQLRKVSTFARLSLFLTRPSVELEDPLASRGDAAVFLRLLQTRALPALSVITTVVPEAVQTRKLVARLVLDVLCLGGSRVSESVAEILTVWWSDTKNWREHLQREIMENLSVTTEWPLSIRLLNAFVKDLKPELRQILVTFAFPLFCERLIDDPPPSSPPLTALLSTLAQTLPTLFYRPLFLCAASGKDATVVTQLRVITSLARHFPGFWTNNDEMVAVALMSNPASSISDGDRSAMLWSKARLGQCVVTLELIAVVKQLITEKKDPTAPLESGKDANTKFLNALEARLAILIDARETTTLLPFSHRLLLTCLLLEMRLYTRSLKPAAWLYRVILWASQGFLGAELGSQTAGGTQTVDQDAVDEWSATKNRIANVYVECSDRGRSINAKRQSHYRMSSLLAGAQANLPPPDLVLNQDRLTALNALPMHLGAATLTLLVTVCGLVTAEEHKLLAAPLWNNYLEAKDKQVVAPACFLLMQCAEKAPSRLMPLVHAGLKSPDPEIRHRAINRIARLFSWRLQILTQTFIPDRARRRPFRLARRPISFVASDVGSNRYVAPERPEEIKLQLGTSIPPEVRRKILELGWGTNEKDENDAAQKWERAPISLLPNNELEHMGANHQGVTSAEANTDTPVRGGGGKGLLRRKSSGSNFLAGMKKKAVFVPQLLSVFPVIAELMFDSDLAVSGAACQLILLLMRDDPVLLSRPILEDISGEPQESTAAIHTLRSFLHAQETLPPGLTHHIFNHIGGLLKTFIRQSASDSGVLLSRCLPIVAELVPQVSEVSYRDLRRNKLDNILLPSFTPIPYPNSASGSTTQLPNFPHIALTRTAQNMLMLNILRRNPKDVTGIRKGFSDLPTLCVGFEGSVEPLTLGDFIPCKTRTPRSKSQADEQRTGSGLARSYILACTQMFQSLSRHMSDRVELGKYMEGINRIVIARGDDIGIVAHALIAYMTASTRFRRMFSSGAGFSLFMPAVFKVYCEAEAQVTIRRAIEYAVRRFHALHKVVFVFQALEAASHMIHQPRWAPVDQEWFAGNVFDLLSMLSRPPSPRDIDVAGIHGSNKLQEEETLITMVNEKPELLLPSLTRTSSRTSIPEDLSQVAALESELTDASRFSLDDFVRLFLTIIPHNPFIIRAQYFLRLLRLLAPSFYNGSATARNVLREGIQAFGQAVFERLQSRAKTVEGEVPAPADVNPAEGSLDNVYGTKPTLPSDHVAMRREYLLLIVAYMRSGGQFDKWAMQRVLQSVREALRDAPYGVSQPVSEFLGVYTRTVIAKEGTSNQRNAAVQLKEIGPIIRLYGSILDLSPAIEHMTTFIKDSAGMIDKGFARMVVSDWCGPAVDICHAAASENILASMPSRKAVVSLLAVSVSFPGVDVIAAIERQMPTSRFLAGVVFPLCLLLETSQQVAARSQKYEAWRGEAHRKAWIRLLAYAMSVHSPNHRGAVETKSQAEKLSGQPVEKAEDTTERALAFAVAVQIVKLIVIRAELDVSAILPSIWFRVTEFIHESLRDGSASFVLSPSTQAVQPSPPVSPSLQPRSPVSPTPDHGRAFPFDPVTINVPRRNSGSTSVRVVDFLLWSLLELVCRTRSPLMPLLKYWIQEKVLHLEDQIRARAPLSPSAGQGRPIIRDSRRLSTMFAKPRHAGRSRSPGASPEGSPAFGATGGGQLSRSPSLLSLEPGANARALDGALSPDSPIERYDRFPNSSPTPGQSSTAPKIRHLGPTKKYEGIGLGITGAFGVGVGVALGRTNSASRQADSESAHVSAMRSALRTTHVSSGKLVQATHWRVRVVQSAMGYDPLPMDDVEDDDGDMKAWTRAVALRQVVRDMQDMMDEFHNWFIGDRRASRARIRMSLIGTLGDH